ncbi:MAG TPA: cyclically-permuted mutarotase family protein [Rikenellaceae bacterium]|nr:cyclically-permuted mutarotase family protein [Rikenellaceae bacterium]
MKNNIKTMLLSAVLLSGSCSSSEDGRISWGRLPDLPNPPSVSEYLSVPLGVSAPFMGLLGETLVVAGGCNFPDKPVADGGCKRFYDEIWALDLSGNANAWKLVGHLPRALAYGCSVTTPSGIVCVGGNDSERSFAECFSLRWSADRSEIVAHPLQSLPCTVDNSSTAFSSGSVFVAGGNCDGQPSRMVFRGDLSPEGDSIQWNKMSDFPGPARVQPVLAAIGSGTDLQVCLAGGFQPGDNKVPPQIPSNVLVWKENEWTEVSSLPTLSDGSPRTLTGGCAVAMADNSVLFFGGVNYDCFFAAVDRPRCIAEAEAAGDSLTVAKLKEEGREYLRHDVSWYKFNDDLWLYNIASGEWKCLGTNESLARAGAGAVICENNVFIVCGELKPGIRTPQVSVVTINE